MGPRPRPWTRAGRMTRDEAFLAILTDALVVDYQPRTRR
jgi:hypothetical protein